VGHARGVGHEHLVEEAALGELGHFDVVVDVHAGVDLRAGVPPGGDVVAGGHDERAKAQFSFAHVSLSEWVDAGSRRASQRKRCASDGKGQSGCSCCWRSNPRAKMLGRRHPARRRLLLRQPIRTGSRGQTGATDDAPARLDQNPCVRTAWTGCPDVTRLPAAGYGVRACST
jgi:hypothetical protein